MIRRDWYKIRTLSGKEVIGYREVDVKTNADGQQVEQAVITESGGTMCLCAPFTIFIDANRNVHMIPEIDAPLLKGSVLTINLSAVESLMPYADTSEIVKRISTQLSGLVIPDAAQVSKIIPASDAGK